MLYSLFERFYSQQNQYVTAVVAVAANVALNPNTNFHWNYFFLRRFCKLIKTLMVTKKKEENQKFKGLKIKYGLENPIRNRTNKQNM
uniref:Uncharacterized protein n=1 Tax=Glossina brevipalpis TaxID=37001 RepID=A0A1A9VZL5_9MUSC